MTVLLDTGPLVAALDRSDKHHLECAELLRSLAEGSARVLVPATVVVEVCWLLEKFRGPQAEAQFLDVVAAGVLELLPITPTDVGRMAELVRQYADFPLGAVDASVIALAERMDVHELATLDRRHFTAVRPRHLDSFTIRPYPTSSTSDMSRRPGSSNCRADVPASRVRYLSSFGLGTGPSSAAARISDRLTRMVMDRVTNAGMRDRQAKWSRRGTGKQARKITAPLTTNGCL